MDMFTSISFQIIIAAILLAVALLIITAPLRWLFDALNLSNKERDTAVGVMCLALLIWWGKSYQPTAPMSITTPMPMPVLEVVQPIYLPLVMR
ncbi:MAG: hypothetical protein WCK70_05020 [Chloroflexales bacterium]